jgi:flagellar assembly factor FliW
MMTTMSAPTEAKTVQFVEPLPGFDDRTDYTLAAIDPQGLLYSMRAVNDPDLRFVLTPADCFFDDYAPDLEPVVTEALDLDDDAEVTVLVMLTISAGLADATANLRAPIVISNATGRAIQAVLDDDTLPMRRPLVANA